MTTVSHVDFENLDDTDALDVAARRLYEAEVALHAARQTGQDNWVRAAADRLHEAVMVHCRCQAAAATPQ